MKYDHFWDILKIDFETQNFESLVWDHQQGLFCELAPLDIYILELLSNLSKSLNIQNLPIFEIFYFFRPLLKLTERHFLFISTCKNNFR